MIASDVAAGAAAPACTPDLEPISWVCNGQVCFIEEAGRRYVYMEGLRFLVRGSEKTMDALLCPNYPNPTYPTKLFLPENLGLSLNWNEDAFIMARHWFTWSWKDVSADQALIEILAGHLKAFQ